MSSMRIGGLASGMDTDQIITDLMNVERTRRLRTTEVKKQQDEWRLDSLHETNRNISNFINDIRKEFGVSSINSTSPFLTTSTDNFTWVNSATSSNTDVFTASAKVDALEGSYSVNVTQTASKAVKISSSAITQSGGDTTSLYKQFGITGTVSFDIMTNDGTESFTFYEYDTLEEITAAINDKDLGVEAYYDEDADMFFLNTEETGLDEYFKISNDVQDLFATHLKLDVVADTEYSGSDLSMTLAGNTITNSSNNVSIYGIDLAVKGTGTSTVSVATDVDTFYSKVEAFVEKYNELIAGVNGALNEKVYRDFLPLTDDQRKSLSEDEIKLWEDKAKSGLLKNDDVLSGYVSNLRTDTYASYYSSYTSSAINTKATYSHMLEIGITTSSYSEKGKLVIDEDKLRAAIQDKPEEVLKLLFGSPSDEDLHKSDGDLTTSQKAQKYNESGIFNRLFNTSVNSLKSIVEKGGAGDDAELLRSVKFNILMDFVTEKSGISTLEQNIFDYNKFTKYQENILTSIENRYWKQYSAMETALNKMNQQSSWLSQQLG